MFGLDHHKNEVAIKRQVGYISPDLLYNAWGRIGRLLRFVKGFYPDWDDAYCQDLLKRFRLGLDASISTLSFGERTKLGLTVALSHRPALLLLDEPSIGLDVVAKQRIRDTIRRMSELENVGVLLTSHDAGDLEALCKRVIIINHGQIVYQDRVSALKRRYLTTKEVSVRYEQRVPKDFSIKGGDVLKTGKYGVKLRFDTQQISTDAIMSNLAERGNLIDINITDPELEEVISKIYQQVEINP